MPELPDVVVYLEALERLIAGHRLREIRLLSPFVLRSVRPHPEELHGRRVETLRRLGKRIVLEFEGDLYLVIHLMIAGRLRWRSSVAKVNRRLALAVFDFGNGALLLTEAGTKKRASVHLCRGARALAQHDPGGLEVLDADLDRFRRALSRESHTLKRALTDPRLFSGIGNAYSDEILHRARLSPFKLTGKLSDEETVRLHDATRTVLREWIARLRDEAGDGFPEKVTAFREAMAVHGRFRRPCPECGSPVQRIVYAENEANYCPTCQTGGTLLADRGLSRLLKKDWPRTLDELERRRGGSE
jgi:formamidopyrimidine-DNA glycosylase